MVQAFVKKTAMLLLAAFLARIVFVPSHAVNAAAGNTSLQSDMPSSDPTQTPIPTLTSTPTPSPTPTPPPTQAPSPAPTLTPTSTQTITPTPIPSPGSAGGDLTDEQLNQAVAGASDWAIPELKQAILLHLTSDAVLGFFQQPISRENFAGIAVKLYETLRGPADPFSPNPFTDTDSVNVLIAFKLGIVKGITPDTFAPNAAVTRQEMAVMLLRTIKAAKPDASIDTSSQSCFDDENQIASWALDAVRFANNNGLMKGIDANTIDPLGLTTREQAVVLVKRAYDAFK